jgi:YD repeat-containing protein
VTLQGYPVPVASQDIGTRLEYTTKGQLSFIRAEDDITRSWTYYPNGQVHTETNPESGTTTYAYDAAGVLSQKTDAKGTTFVYTRDRNERVTRITAGSSVTETRYVAGSDDIDWTSNGSVATTFGYDAAGRQSTDLTVRLGD